MNPTEEQYFALMTQQLEAEKIKNLQLQNDVGKISSFPQPNEQNLIEFQLDPDKILNRMHHMLSGHILKKTPGGGDDWEEPDDDRLKILSDYGVKQIMHILSNYINPNVLLGNYTQEQVTWKTKDFAIELIDLIYNRYEVFFHFPTPEELYDKYLPIVKKDKMDINELELYERCLQWSDEELQQKTRHFPMIIQMIIDQVHATYLRALNGEERESLRRQTHISETVTPYNPMLSPQKSGGLFSRWRK